jgi:hypothetical protein
MIVGTILVVAVMSGCGSSNKKRFLVAPDDADALVFAVWEELSPDETYYWRV